MVGKIYLSRGRFGAVISGYPQRFPTLPLTSDFAPAADFLALDGPELIKNVYGSCRLRSSYLIKIKFKLFGLGLAKLLRF